MDIVNEKWPEIIEHLRVEHELSGIVLRYKYNFIINSRNFRNAYFQREKVLLFNIFNACIHIHKYKYSVVDNLKYF
mgnify:CR=1 FL=1